MLLDPKHLTLRPRVHWRRPFAIAVLTALALVTASGARTANAPPHRVQPGTLIVVSTTDVKGKTSPCGCHTPKGGFARRETFIDSLRASSDRVVAVDCGGWFPEGDSSTRDVAAFVAQEMAVAGLDAVGTSERELHFGLAFLEGVVQHAKLPLVCANLQRRGGKGTLFPAFSIIKAGGLNVGVFSLISNTVDLGPAKDSLTVEDPVLAARRTVEQLHARGAGVIVLLSNLGKIESEDLVTAVDGVDAVVVGHNVPILQQGRTIRNSVASYGGEQGHYVGVTTLNVDAQGRAFGGSAVTIMLGPEFADKGTTLARVKGFEDAHNERLREVEREHAMESSVPAEAAASAPHYVGAEFCARCHAPEYKQWQTTVHARAWATLVEQKKDATPECVKCHVLGNEQPGGFRAGADAAKLTNVQCESCHGMGTEHEAWASNHPKVAEAVCRGCHTDVSSPAFRFALYQPHILHHVPAELPALPPKPRTMTSMH